MLEGPGVHPQLLLGLPQGRVQVRRVTGLHPAAGEGDLAGVGRQVARALGEDDDQVVGRRVEQHQHRGGPGGLPGGRGDGPDHHGPRFVAQLQAGGGRGRRRVSQGGPDQVWGQHVVVSLRKMVGAEPASG